MTTIIALRCESTKPSYDQQTILVALDHEDTEELGTDAH